MKLEILVGPICVLLGMLFALYVKDKAHEVAKEQFTESIKSALATFKLEFVNELDKRFVSSESCHLKMEYRDDRLDICDDRLNVMEGRLNNDRSKT